MGRSRRRRLPGRLPGQGHQLGDLPRARGQFYERTAPERCYTDAETAEADGYRAARR